MIRVNGLPAVRRRSELVCQRGARWTAEVQLARYSVANDVWAQTGNVVSRSVNVAQSSGTVTVDFRSVCIICFLMRQTSVQFPTTTFLLGHKKHVIYRTPIPPSHVCSVLVEVNSSTFENGEREFPDYCDDVAHAAYGYSKQ